MARHAHAELSLTMILSGAVQERVGAKEVIEPAELSVGVKPFYVEHSNQFAASGARLVSVTLSKSWHDEVDQPLARLKQWWWGSGGTEVPVFLNLLQRLRESPGDPETWLEPLVVDLLAAFSGDRRYRRNGPAPSWLACVRERLLEEQPPTVRTTALAREAGIHPVSLARAFRRQYGESISDCVRRIKLQRAASALKDPRISLAEVALQAGLADQSHLTRLCRQETGVTPAALRRAQAAA